MMPVDPNRYQSESLPKYRWQTFFAELLENFKGQPVNIISGAEFLHSQPPQDTAPLETIDYDSKHRGTFKHKGLLTISTAGTQGESVSIDVPTIVWIYRDLEGELLGIEVIDEQNNRVVVRFA
jgi:hypothetical protein